MVFVGGFRASSMFFSSMVLVQKLGQTGRTDLWVFGFRKAEILKGFPGSGKKRPQTGLLNCLADLFLV